MGGLAHYIERAGVATTGISLIREHTEALRPPRSLWVPFPLGRPLGRAGDSDFQTRVLRSTLRLLDTATEPCLEDYPEEAGETAGAENWVCPVSFPPAEPGTLEARLRAEIARLRPWAQETQRRRGRTLLGASGATPDDVDTMAAVLSSIAGGASLYEMPAGGAHVEWWHSMPFLLRHIAEDLRVFYQEAVAVRPGQGPAPDHVALTHWVFTETVLGEALSGVGKAITDAGDRRLLTLRGYIIPEGYVEGDESFGKRQAGDPPGFQRALVGNALLRGETE